MLKQCSRCLVETCKWTACAHLVRRVEVAFDIVSKIQIKWSYKFSCLWLLWSEVVKLETSINCVSYTFLYYSLLHPTIHFFFCCKNHFYKLWWWKFHCFFFNILPFEFYWSRKKRHLFMCNFERECDAVFLVSICLSSSAWASIKLSPEDQSFTLSCRAKKSRAAPILLQDFL